MTKIFKTPFGALGDKQEVPVTTQADGSVSYEQGFGVDYQRDYEDPQAKDIPREGLNQLFYDVTKALGELQKLGYMQWQAGTYQAGDRVAEGGVAYKAIRTTTNKPPHSDWVSVLEGGEFVTVDTNQTVGGVKTFTKFPVTPSAAPTADYQAANKKYVDDSAIGVGQTINGFASPDRVAGTVYTNTSNRTIFVSVTVAVPQDLEGEARVELSVDGLIVAANGGGQGLQSRSVYACASFPVPAGSTYAVSGLLSGKIYRWVELR